MVGEYLLIEASAGTGKTQALARRLIELVQAKVKPQEIVALTFSRAAAGEIFERFVKLLADEAERSHEYANLLREVIATQHLSQIGTLDSFLMRIVRSFPLELGIFGKLELMDDYEAAVERARVSFGILRRTDAALKRAFGEAFRLAMNREDVRSFVETYRKFIGSWHERLLAKPDKTAWGEPTAIWGESPEYLQAREEDLAKAADSLEGIVDSKEWRAFVQWIRDFRGTFSGMIGFAKKMVENPDLFTGANIDISYNRHQYSFGGIEARAIRNAMLTVLGYSMRMQLESARGIHSLISVFEAEYAKTVRNRGKLVFSDIPRLIMGLDDNVRMALEYRMDSKIRAWALDEFQDTSREQWHALSGLLDEAKQSNGEKGVFIVGDRKQAIYGWRNGDLGIFTGERKSGRYEVLPLVESWRFGKAITKAVNAVFVDGRMKDEFPGWESPVHSTHYPERDGFVQVIDAESQDRDAFVDPVYNALKAVDPVHRGIAAAILVRSNGMGKMLAEELKRKGLEGVVWEGESSILDTPAMMPFLDVLALADHPNDRWSYEHFIRSPLAKAKYGGGVPSPKEISSEFAMAFTTKGIARTFSDLRALLPQDSDCAWSVACEERFADMLRAAVEFELSLKPGTRLADFADYLSSKCRRNVAEPGRIKILTIHRSKGLGFDYVVLPLYEPEGLHAEPDGPLVSDDWILPYPNGQVMRRLPRLSAVWNDRKTRCEQESLCTYYVAMTRAKYAMTVVAHPQPAKGKSGTVRFSDLVREAIPEPIGDPRWYEQFSPKKRKERLPMEFPERRARQTIIRRMPSLTFRSGQSAGELFSLDGGKKAVERGIQLHEKYAKVQWMDEANAKDEFDRSLVKPDGCTALWREKPYEIFANGEWISGRIDRVVFVGNRATIYDFKTNSKRRDETDDEFAVRLRNTYAPQMRAYRQAVSRLAGIDVNAISTKLLATETHMVIEITGG